MKTWRDIAAPIIQAVLERTRGKPEKEVREALREAYPFHERRYFPYKVWCSEVRRQRKLPKDTKQMELFEST